MNSSSNNSKCNSMMCIIPIHHYHILTFLIIRSLPPRQLLMCYHLYTKVLLRVVHKTPKQCQDRVSTRASKCLTWEIPETSIYSKGEPRYWVKHLNTLASLKRILNVTWWYYTDISKQLVYPANLKCLMYYFGQWRM